MWPFPPESLRARCWAISFGQKSLHPAQHELAPVVLRPHLEQRLPLFQLHRQERRHAVGERPGFLWRHVHPRSPEKNRVAFLEGLAELRLLFGIVSR